MDKNGSLIIGYDFSNDSDTGVVVVGQKDEKGEVHIVNAFSGEEALEVYNKLRGCM